MKKKILIIDDEPELVKGLKIRLEVSGYETVSAYDGEQGLCKAQMENPDLIILDILMPKMDGYTVLRELKKKEETKGIPVIVLTAKAKMEDLFGIEGIKDYIIKPFENKDLLEKIGIVLGR